MKNVTFSYNYYFFSGVLRETALRRQVKDIFDILFSSKLEDRKVRQNNTFLIYHFSSFFSKFYPVSFFNLCVLFFVV